MTFAEAEQFGKYVKEVRAAKGITIEDVVSLIEAKFPMLHVTEGAIKRIERGGVWAYEIERGIKERVLDAPHQVRLRTAIAAVLDMKHQEARMANTTKTTESKKEAVTVNATTTFKKESGFRVVRKDRSFVTNHGFSAVMVKDTLANIKTLGLPTKDVKAALVKKFAEYVETLDK